MAFTDNCDVYAALHEDGINLVARHVMRQRPSEFNFATQYVIDHPYLACKPVDHTADVTNHGNPLFKLQASLPLFGADAPPVGLNFCLQIVDAKIDFHQGNVITLPAELNPPLPPQHLAAKVTICGGLDCPAMEFIDHIKLTGSQDASGRTEGLGQPPPPVVPPTRKLICFCLDAYMVGHVEITAVLGKPSLVGKVDGVDIVDIKPDELEQNITCYIRTMFELILREKMTIPFTKMFFDPKIFWLPKIALSLSPNPPVPHNPAIEDDQVKVFVDLQVLP